VPVGTEVPGPITLGFIRQWNAMVGIDIVEQGLSHLPDDDVPTLKKRWRTVYDSV
jgi:hypothetical protein